MGAAEVISFEEVRARKQWRVLSQVFIYAPLRYALLLLSTVNSEGE
jgi:hypothetical protein